MKLLPAVWRIRWHHSEWPLRKRSRRQRLSQSRARQSVFAALGFLVMLNAGMNLALETVKPEWRDPEYGHRLKDLRRCQQAEPDRPLVLVLGSSRPQMGLSPAALGLDNGPGSPLVYNFSAAGCGPIHELLTLKRLLDSGIQPSAVLVEVLRPVLAGNGPAEKLLHPGRLSYADLHRLRLYCDDPQALRWNWLQQRLFPWHTLRLNLLSHWAGSLLHWKSRQDFMWKQLKERGWLPYFFEDLPAEKRLQGIAAAQAQYAGYFAQYQIAPRPDQAYRELLSLCRERGIRVGFFIMPESPTFRYWYPPHAEETARNYLEQLAREFSVPVFDASAWINDETAFADSHHLMRSGAEQFSRRFGQECLAPWLRQSP
jgi:hypothetical protein